MKMSKEKIMLIMARQQMNFTDVAKKCGVGGSTISTAMKRENNTLAFIGKMAAALNVDVTEIID